MRRAFFLGISMVVGVPAAACGDLKNAGLTADAGPVDEAGTAGDGGGDGGAGAGPTVVVDTLVTGRSRLGARSTVGYKPWRSGLVAQGDKVYWVESGTSPGLYASSATQPCSSASCVEKVASLTRPSAFTTSATHVYLADTTVIKRFAFATGTSETVVSHNEEIVNLATAGTRVFWTADTNPAMRATVIGGATSTPINSNGTPVAMAVAGDRLFWAGVDISGQVGAMQSVGTDGSGAQEVSRFSTGFQTMHGSDAYLYYGKDDTPGSIHRITLSNDRDEILDKDALGVTDFAIDATHAYWVEPGDGDLTNGRVRRVAHDSKTAETLAVGIPFPVAIALSGKTVFVASAGTKAATFADGKILRLSITD